MEEDGDEEEGEKEEGSNGCGEKRRERAVREGRKGIESEVSRRAARTCRE